MRVSLDKSIHMHINIELCVKFVRIPIGPDVHLWSVDPVGNPLEQEALSEP